MSWNTEMVTMVRLMIGDWDTPYKYSDERLQELILVSAQLTLTEVDFEQTYLVSVDESSITPDPTDTSAREEGFINLVSIRAACIADRGQASKNVGKGLIIKEGSSFADLREVAKARLEILKVGWCKVYEDTKFEFQVKKVATAGGVILSPFRTVVEEYEPDFR